MTTANNKARAGLFKEEDLPGRQVHDIELAYKSLLTLPECKHASFTAELSITHDKM